MFKYLLLASCIFSSTFAADDGLESQTDSSIQNSTIKGITHTDCIDPTRKVHTTTSFMKLGGNVYFRPQHYLKDFATSNKEIEIPSLDYIYETNYVRSIRIWCDGHPDTLFLYVSSFVRGLDDHNYYLMRLRPEISSRKIAPEAKREFTLSFKKDGTFNCIDPGQPTQSTTSLTVMISSKFNDDTQDKAPTTMHHTPSDKVYSIFLDLNGLTSHNDECTIIVKRIDE